MSSAAPGGLPVEAAALPPQEASMTAPAREPPRVVVDVGGYRKPDLVLVDLLARLRLVASRLGAGLVVLGASPELERLLAFVGLLAVVPLDGSELDRSELDRSELDRSELDRSELGRESEPCEQPGVEEVVDVGDPAVAQLEHLDAPRHEPPAGTGFVLGEAG
jgi:hypothetical protein